MLCVADVAVQISALLTSKDHRPIVLCEYAHSMGNSTGACVCALALLGVGMCSVRVCVCVAYFASCAGVRVLAAEAWPTYRCSLYAHFMLTLCSLYAHFMITLCSL